MNENKKMIWIISIVLPVIIAAICAFGISKMASSPKTFEKTIVSLDEKKTVVMEMTAAATAASAAASLLPGDMCTPLANKLADISQYFLIVICAIYLEKYMLPIFGYVSFTWIIPLALLALSIGYACGKKWIQNLAYRFIAFGLALFLIVPVSVKLSDFIDKTYQDTIQATINDAKDSAEEIENSQIEKEEAQEEESEGGLFSNLFHDIKDTVSEGVSNLTTGVSDQIKKLENVLSRYIEALAIMIVTSCIIPIGVILILLWIVKMLFSSNYSFPDAGYFDLIKKEK